MKGPANWQLWILLELSSASPAANDLTCPQFGQNNNPQAPESELYGPMNPLESFQVEKPKPCRILRSCMPASPASCRSRPSQTAGSGSAWRAAFMTAPGTKYQVFPGMERFKHWARKSSRTAFLLLTVKTPPPNSVGMTSPSLHKLARQINSLQATPKRPLQDTTGEV